MKLDDATEALIARMAGHCVAGRVRVVNRVITGVYDDAMRPFGIRVSQGNILVAVARLGDARPADVCRLLRLEKSTLSRDVELMKKEGWLESDPPGGGRNQILRVTDRGLALLLEVQPAWEKAQSEAVRLLSEDGVNALRLMASRVGFGAKSDRGERG